jgi:DNA polymerase III subunit delta'
MKNQTNKLKLTWPEIGQDRAVSFLEKSLLADRLAQTYIFVGPSDLGKNTLALAFARNLLASDKNFSGDLMSAESSANSDLHILKREEDKQLISVEQTREFMKMLNFSSFLNSYKIGIIKEADKLTQEAKSALLKTLEEPNKQVIIILLVNDLSILPATIVSRAQIVRFHPVSQEFIYNYLLKLGEKKRSRAKALAAISLGRPLKAKRFFSSEKLYETELEKAKLLLDFFELDLAQRRQALQAYFKGSRNEQLKEAESLLASWEGLWRDLMLALVDGGDLFFYQDLKEDILRIRQEKSDDKDFFVYLLNLRERLRKSGEYLQANVNVENSLLNFVYHI